MSGYLLKLIGAFFGSMGFGYLFHVRNRNLIIGSIGGVKFKLAGAVSKKADVFLVPAGENYKEAIKYKKKNNYDIKIIGVSNLEEAILELEKLEV